MTDSNFKPIASDFDNLKNSLDRLNRKLSLLFNQVKGKLKREVLQMPIISYFVQKSYQQKLLNYQPNLPSISAEHQNLLDIVDSNGVAMTSLKDLNIPKTQELVDKANWLILNAPEFNETEITVGIRGHILREFPEVLLWGLDPQLLDMAENYIGLPIYYLGAQVKRELTNGKSLGVRKWHIDTEDYRMLKIIIYLNDVDEFGGPFQYLSKQDTEIAKKSLGYKSGLIDDDVMSSHLDPEKWIACTGSEYTATLIDTANIFHRAKPPTHKERKSITFHYISQNPIHLRSKNLSISSKTENLCKNLTERQLRCIFPL